MPQPHPARTNIRTYLSTFEQRALLVVHARLQAPLAGVGQSFKDFHIAFSFRLLCKLFQLECARGQRSTSNNINNDDNNNNNNAV